MSVYKVPQDVEAEDKLLGPFSFKQFVFIIIMVGCLYFCYLFFIINPFLVIFPLPFAAFFGILGLWPRKDQPVEVYLGALIRFYLKPRKRIWNQEGSVELVHITAPKVDQKVYTDGLTRVEVQSRLKNLASTLDTRGWASKNVEVQDVTSYIAQQPMVQSDRLVMPQVVAQPTVDPIDIHQSDDMMDPVNNPVASHFDQLSQATVTQAREAAIAQMQQAQVHEDPQAAIPQPEPPQSYIQQRDEVTNEPPAQAPAPDPMPQAQPQPTPPPQSDTPQEDMPQYNPYPNIKQTVIKPVSHEPELGQEQPQTPPMTKEQSTAILNLANNSDLNVSTIAREAEKALKNDDVIQLH